MVMSYIVMQKRGKSIYVYEAENHWIKEKNQPRQKRKYLGRIDPLTGEFIRSKGSRGRKAKSMIPKASRDYGNVYLLDKISEGIHLKKVLKYIYPEEWNKILSLAFFALSENLPLYLFEQWKAHTFIELLEKETVSSQSISKLLKLLGNRDRLQSDFFTHWCKEKGDTKALIFDITSVSSYSEIIDMIEWGYNRDKENLPQINIGMVFGEPSSLPLFYSMYPGSIPDIVTLKNIISRLNKFNMKPSLFILDRGFFSRNNITLLMEEDISFLMPVPFTTNLSKEILSEYKDTLSSPSNAFLYNGKIMFGIEKEIVFNKEKFTVFLYLDKERESIEIERFLKNIIRVEEEFDNTLREWMKREKKKRKEKEEERGKEKEKGERKKEKKKEKGNKKENKKNKKSAEDECMEEGSIEDEECNIDLPFANEREVKEFINSISRGYAKYFDITFKKNRVSDEVMPSVTIKRNNEEIEKALMKKGRIILITNNNNLKEKGKKEVLYLYRKRNDVERVFNALKNKIDGNRLRTHSSDTTSGKLFILFIALILYSALDKLMRENNLYEKYTMNELLEMMKNIRTIELKSGPIFLTEIPKKARDVFKLFNIELPQYA